MKSKERIKFSCKNEIPEFMTSRLYHEHFRLLWLKYFQNQTPFMHTLLGTHEGLTQAAKASSCSQGTTDVISGLVPRKKIS